MHPLHPIIFRILSSSVLEPNRFFSRKQKHCFSSQISIPVLFCFFNIDDTQDLTGVISLPSCIHYADICI